MRSAAACRYAANVCFFFAFLMTFEWFQGNGLAFGLLAMITFITSYAAASDGGLNIILRGLLGLLPFISLTLSVNISGLIASALVATYVLVIFIIGSHVTEHWIYIKAYSVMAIMILIKLLVEAFVGVNDISSPLFSAAFLFLGMMTLKNLRWGNRSANIKLFTLEAAELIIPVSIVAVVAAILYILLTNVSFLVGGFAIGFAFIISTLSGWLGKFMDNFNVASPKPTEKLEEIAEELEEATEEITSSAEDTVWFNAPSDRVLWMILIGLLLLAVLGVLFAALRNYFGYSRNKLELVGAEDIEEYREESKSRKRFRTKKLKVESYQERVRKLYRDYLGVIKGRGVLVERSDTSHDIMLDGAKVVSDEINSENIRRIYIKARYGKADDVTKEDYESLKSIITSLTSKK